jgi:hypothetical protein
MTEFTLGARASCSDGACGVVSGTILDPAARTVTHLVIESQHGTGGRLVPAEEVLADTWSGAGDYSSIGMGLGHRTPLVISQAVPLGETEVDRHDSVHAVDGQIGQAEGFVVDPADEKVTHILLGEGHLWGRKQVALPVSAVASVDDGIRLNITKQQVEDLPPFDQPG